MVRAYIQSVRSLLAVSARGACDVMAYVSVKAAYLSVYIVRSCHVASRSRA
jgi:hypothetical protein